MNINMLYADDYFLSRLPIVNLQLAQGGVRLAATLNRIFGSRTQLHSQIEGFKRAKNEWTYHSK